MKKCLMLMLITVVGACCEVSLAVDGGTVAAKDGGGPDGGSFDAGPVRPIPDGGPGCLPSTPGNPCSGALRGAAGCDAPIAQCDAATEFILSVACHSLPDGGQYEVNGIAGSWCYPLPPQCQAASSCGCLEQYGGFSHDAGRLDCPGNYFFCIDRGLAVPDLHCNPP